MATDRTIQYKLSDKEWVDVGWPDVKTNMVVRMFEADGTPISMLESGSYEAITTKDSYIGPRQVWEIIVDKIVY